MPFAHLPLLDIPPNACDDFCFAKMGLKDASHA
jgi:hypothetical protein